MSLTLRAYGTRATVSDAGRRDHTHRPIMFGASLLWVEWCSLPTTQRAVSLGEKVVSRQASNSRYTRPLWGTEGESCWRGVS
jgi:hypothetical protein